MPPAPYIALLVAGWWLLLHWLPLATAADVWLQLCIPTKCGNLWWDKLLHVHDLVRQKHTRPCAVRVCRGLRRTFRLARLIRGEGLARATQLERLWVHQRKGSV